jgi:DNA processing protein
VDIDYPAAHHELLARIAETGLVLSENGLGQPARRYHFLARNRIIAAITRGTVVVEAAYRSGSLSTARIALDLGRHVMAVPGPITSQASSGVHELMRTHPDVQLVTCADHVRDLCGAIGDEVCLTVDGPSGVVDTLTADAAAARDHLSHKPLTVSEVAHRIHITVPRAMAAIAELQVAGLAAQTSAGWVLTTSGAAPAPR